MLDATGIERILREPKAPKPTHTDVTVTVAGTTEGTTTTKEVGAFTAGAGADGAEDSAAAAVPRAPAVKQEKIINIPTTLVGLLLSKRPKAKSTTINVIQQMTHTVISKMPPAGILPGRAGAASSPSEPGEGKDSAGDTTAPGAVSAGAGVEVEGSAVEGGGDVEAEKEGEAGSSKTTRRRRTVSEEDGGTESDGESADSTSTDAEEGGEGDGDDVSTEESIGGSDIESEDDLEGSDEENFVDATTEPVTFLPASVSEKEAGVALSVEFGVHQDEKEGGADEKAEAGVETAVEADVEGDVITTATAAAVPAATSDGTVAPVVAVEERKTLKMLMIAESERLGFVSFRVVGYFPENVDMVVEALQSIIRGDRIMEVMEKLRADSRGLKWPPKDALRKERFDKNDALRERPERPERVDGERPSGSSKYKSRDSELRVRAPKPKRREYRDGVSGGAEGDDDAGAATGGGVGEEGGFPAERVVSSRYKGKKAFKKDREGVDPADPASGGATSAEGSSVFKRAPRGPPKLGEDGKPKLPIRGNKFVRNTATAAASAGGDAPSNN